MLESSSQDALHIYTDGACSNQVGGLGVAVMVNGAIAETHSEGLYLQTTNNQMELMAVIAALRLARLRLPSLPIIIYSDSQYVIKGINEWMEGWKASKWTTSSGAPVKNKELWRALEIERRLHKLVSFKWVKGHNGNKGNEKADELAVAGRSASRGTILYPDLVLSESVEAARSAVKPPPPIGLIERALNRWRSAWEHDRRKHELGPTEYEDWQAHLDGIPMSEVLFNLTVYEEKS